jgi:hypothetical protein
MSTPSNDTAITDDLENHHVARLQIKPPPFYQKSPVLWFKQMESQFFLAGIQSTITKYHHAMAVLPEEVICNVDLSINDYDALKVAVIDSLKANRFELIERAMAALELGDRKPSQLVIEIQRRFSEVGIEVDETIVKSRLLGSLPSHIRSALVGHENSDLKTFSKIADSMLAVSPAATPFRVQHSAMDTAAAARPRPRQFSNAPRPFYANQRPKVCNAHIYYGSRARTCRSWCQWPGNKPRILRSGEKTPSHSRTASPSSSSRAASPPNA